MAAKKNVGQTMQDMVKSDGILIHHNEPYQYREGDLNVTRGSAWSGPGCHLGCGVLLYTDDDGMLVKVEGDPEHPYNEGRLCIRCLDASEVTNSPQRLKYPMKRAREDRGKNTWERISWDEAIDICVDELSRIRDEYGAESVLFVHGTGRDIAPYQSRLCWAYGSPNYVNVLTGNACYLPRIAGCAATTGSFWLADCGQQFPDRYDDPRYELTEVMVIWGNNPIISNADGFFGHWVVDLMKMGMKIITIDPRMTWLGARAEIQLPIRPGTDAALALGMLNVIINEDLYDHDFVDCWCYGFDELAERVQEYPPDKVAEITWIPEERIVAAARMIANAKNASMQWGVAVDMTKEALPAGQAIFAIFAITGNLDIPGGCIAPVELLAYSGGWGRELLPPDKEDKRLGLNDYRLLQMGFKQASPDTVIKTLETGEPYELHAAWIQTCNALACMGAEPERLMKAYRKLDFIVDVDLFMTPTAMALADISLPAATFPERFGICLGTGTQRLEVINKVTEIGEAKSDMEINFLVGKRLAPEAYPWDSYIEQFDALLEPTGYTREELQQLSPVYLPFEYKRYEKGLLREDGQVGFQTATGRIELWSLFYNACDLDPLPYFEEPEPGPGSTPEMLDEYPYILTTGARNWTSFHSEHRQIPRLRAIHPDPTIQIHPDTCAELGIEDGDWVWVENYLGRAKSRVQATPIMEHPEVVSCDHAWWLPEADPENLFDVFDLNVNNLVPYKCGKSGFGGNYKTTLVKIYPYKEGETNGIC